MLPAFNYVLLSINLTPRQRKAIEIPEFEIGFSVGRAKRRWMGSLCSRGRGRKDEEYGGGRPLPVRLGASGSSMIGCQIHRPLSEQTQNLRKDKVLGLYSSLHILPSSVSLSCLHTGQYILQENSIHTVSQSVSQSLGGSNCSCSCSSGSSKGSLSLSLSLSLSFFLFLFLFLSLFLSLSLSPARVCVCLSVTHTPISTYAMCMWMCVSRSLHLSRVVAKTLRR